MKIFDAAQFANRVRLAMAEQNLSYRALEAMIDVDQASLNRICKHSKPPNLENYLKLAAWLGAPEAAINALDDVLTWVEGNGGAEWPDYDQMVFIYRRDFRAMGKYQGGRG